MMKHRTNLTLALLLILTACVPGLGTGSGKVEVAQSQAERIAAPDVPATDMDALSAGDAAFAVDLYHAVKGEEENLFFSPYSISTALAMTYAGAREETARQMAETLHFTLPAERLHPACNALALELAGGEDFVLNVVNSLWGQQGYTFLPEFLDLLAENYGAGLRLLDFATATESARVTINDWVSEQTEDKINDLIPQGGVTPDTRLVLVNAIYFNADWLYPFDKDKTHDAPFVLLDGENVSVPMMDWETPERVPYTRGEGYQAVELPYVGGKTSLVLIAPDEGEFAAYEEAFTAEHLTSLLDDLSTESVALTMPKFSYDQNLSLADTLAAMGMPDAMDPARADFSGMDGTRSLYIGNVFHKAFVAVDEAGTEAAAATAVVVQETAISIDDTIELTVDRPFIFLIRDTGNGALLFLGRVENPAG